MARAKKKKKNQVEVGKYITEKNKKRYMTYAKAAEFYSLPYYSYRMKLNAIKRQGKVTRTSSQVGRKLEAAEIVAESVGESKNQIHRFVRLTEVIPELLDMIDRGNIAIMTGVDISYLEEKMQKWLYEYIKDNGVIKSYQVSALREELKTEPELSHQDVIRILNDLHPSRKPAMRINFTSNQLRKYFPAYYSSEEAKEVIEQLLTQWKKEQDKLAKQKGCFTGKRDH